MANATASANGNATPYHIRRYRGYIVITILALILPFIQIDGKQFFMLSFLHMEFHLLWSIYDMQELYLIPLGLVLFFLTLFVATALGGRVWCGWSCPQTLFRTIYRDFIQDKLLGLRKWKIKNKPPKLVKAKDKAKFALGFILFSSLMVLASANVLWYFVSPYEFFDIVLNRPAEHPILLLFWLGFAGFLIFDITYLGERFCKYICPYARIQSVLFDADTPIPIYDRVRGDNSDASRGAKNFESQRDSSGDCTGCEACVRVCPAGIDIRNGLQLACIACLECVDACAPVMDRLGKRNLISWSSEKVLSGEKVNLFRPRMIMYVSLMVIMSGVLVYAGSSRDAALLNINRTTELYVIKEGGQRVDNHYTILVTNTDTKAHMFQLAIEGIDGIDIERPSGAFPVMPGDKVKKVLVLSTYDKLVDTDKRNTSVSFNLKAFSVEEPEKISVTRRAVFLFPPRNEINMD
jgi:cytochrome c oxidase accessory protein FixG